MAKRKRRAFTEDFKSHRWDSSESFRGTLGFGPYPLRARLHPS